MQLPKVLTDIDPKKAKISFVAALGVATILGLATTNMGSRAFSLLAIKDGMAQTMAAAQTGLQTTGEALNSFIGRSPGERGVTDLLKGKKKRFAAAKGKNPDGTEPAQRALGKIFDKPIGTVAEAVTPQQAAVVLPNETAASAVPAAALPPLASILPSIVVPSIGGIGGGGAPGPGGGGGSGGSDPVVTPTVPPVVGSVPEPSTWVLLLFGFGAIGVSLRRAKNGKLSGSGLAGLCAKN